MSYPVSNLCKQLHKVWDYDLALLRAKMQWTCFKRSGLSSVPPIKTVIQDQRASPVGASHARTVTPAASAYGDAPPHLPSPQNKPSYLTWAGLPVVADAVDDIMRDFGVLRHREHVVAGAGDGVPDEEHAVPLPLQQRHSLLPAQASPEPAAAVLRVKISGHGQH